MRPVTGLFISRTRTKFFFSLSVSHFATKEDGAVVTLLSSSWFITWTSSLDALACLSIVEAHVVALSL